MSAFENVTKLVKEWQSQPLPNESKYRDALATFLRARMKDAIIEREYRHIGTTIDIYVKQSGFLGSSEVFIELKHNFLQKAHLDRLVGQIESLRPGKNPIVVILCGKTNPALATRFKERYKELDPQQSNYLYLSGSPLTVIVKEAIAAPPKAGQT